MPPGKHNISRFFKRLDLKLGHKGVNPLTDGFDLPNKIPGAIISPPSELMKQWPSGKPIKIDMSKFKPPMTTIDRITTGKNFFYR
jgi:hypothetical protein